MALRTTAIQNSSHAPAPPLPRCCALVNGNFFTGRVEAGDYAAPLVKRYAGLAAPYSPG